MRSTIAEAIDYPSNVTEPQVIEFTEDHARMIAETHAALLQILNLLEQVQPLIANLGNSPVGKMLGL